jgi:hypothetical protein
MRIITSILITLFLLFNLPERSIDLLNRRQREYRELEKTKQAIYDTFTGDWELVSDSLCYIDRSLVPIELLYEFELHIYANSIYFSSPLRHVFSNNDSDDYRAMMTRFCRADFGNFHILTYLPEPDFQKQNKYLHWGEYKNIVNRRFNTTNSVLYIESHPLTGYLSSLGYYRGTLIILEMHGSCLFFKRIDRHNYHIHRHKVVTRNWAKISKVLNRNRLKII